MDSIGNDYAIDTLRTIVANPPACASTKPRTARMYIGSFPDSLPACEIAEEYEANANVEYAFVDTAECQMFYMPGDNYFENQWMLHNSGQIFHGSQVNDDTTDVDAPQAWDFTTGDEETIIAVIDREIDQNHPDLMPQLWINDNDPTIDLDDDDGNGKQDDTHGWDFTGWDFDTGGGSLNNHGTAVAGVAAGNDDPSSTTRQGIVGIANGCRIMALRANSASETEAAIDYAFEHGAKVINLSTGPDRQALVPAVFDAMEDGLEDYPDVVICIAIGNATENFLATVVNNNYPLTMARRYVVGNVCYNGQRTVGKSFVNSRITLSAPAGADSCSNNCHGLGRYPGGQTRFTWASAITPHEDDDCEQSSNGYTTYFGGTSGSTPVVAGIAALLRSDDPMRPWSSLRRALVASCRDVRSDPTGPTGLVGWDTYTGWGVINAHRALLWPEVLAPVQSSTYWGGDTITLQWRRPTTNTSLDTTDIFVSTSGKAGTYSSVVSDLWGVSSPGSYEWTVPDDIESSSVYFRFVSNHGQGERNLIADSSDVALTIHKPIQGVIQSDTTWSDCVTVKGDVRVPNGRKLTINPGTVVKFRTSDALATGRDVARIEIRVDGQLDAQGTSGSPIVFTSADPAPEVADWYGLVLLDAEASTVEYATLQYARFGITREDGDSLEVRSCLIQECQSACIVSSVSTQTSDHYLIVEDCELRPADAPYGLLADGYDHVLVFRF